ncbi:class I SAM-dependent methyltransferase [Thermopirellula anaerolimosa]
MKYGIRGLVVFALVGACAWLHSAAVADCPSSRIQDAAAFASRDGSGYSYREKAEWILDRLDLRPGDTVVDIGAGDGWWSDKLAQRVVPGGHVFAAEVQSSLVEKMKQRFNGRTEIEPYQCPNDQPGRPEGSVDLAFLSQTYHHLPADGRVAYWQALAEQCKPTGRVCVIETYPEIALRGQDHGTQLSKLVAEAEQGGWIAVEVWFIPGTQHYLAIFAPKRAFFAQSK